MLFFKGPSEGLKIVEDLLINGLKPDSNFCDVIISSLASYNLNDKSIELLYMSLNEGYLNSSQL